MEISVSIVNKCSLCKLRAPTYFEAQLVDMTTEGLEKVRAKGR